jgi:hypothetical protein
MFVNTRNPYMFRSFSFDHPQGAISRALCRYYMSSVVLRSLSIYLVCDRMCISSICVCAWCSCQ